MKQFCKSRKTFNPEITVKSINSCTHFALKAGESLMGGLLREGYYTSAVCGGKGRCGKCKVQVLTGNAAVTSEDERCFSASELEAGWRLSCLLIPTEDLTIAFDWNDESEFEVVSGFVRENVQDRNIPDGSLPVKQDNESQMASEIPGQKPCNIAIDIGTTTIALQLLNEAGQVLDTVTAINSQRKYGADVISRIQASVDGKKGELQQCIRKDLLEGIASLLEASGLTLEQVKKIMIACNTTMSHLLLGYDCEGLGRYPFSPVNINMINESTEKVLGVASDAEVVILPGISAYVGGDIVSGLYACEMYETEEVCLLVDLGTNGEMALGNRERLLVTSTAAGPAFEGGNLTWGVGSVAGAICSVKLAKAENKDACGVVGEDERGRYIHIETIRNQAPVGICGTGVIEAAAEMLREEIIDEMGLLEEDYFEKGFPIARTDKGEQIVITQKDIRELQLAKAAIRAGIETLCLRYGVEKEQVSRVYLAGGFGYKLDVEKAMAIGMFPKEFAGKIEAVGNSALAGAEKFIVDGDGVEKLRKNVEISEEINLSMDKDFGEFYMKYMMFGN